MSVMSSNVLRGMLLAARLLSKALANKETVETVLDVGERIYAHTPTVCPCCHGNGKVSRQKAITIEMSMRNIQ